MAKCQHKVMYRQQEQNKMDFAYRKLHAGKNLKHRELKRNNLIVQKHFLFDEFRCEIHTLWKKMQSELRQHFIC